MNENAISQIQEKSVENSFNALIVDDYFLIRHNFRLLLANMGISITEAKNGQEALDLLLRYEPKSFSFIIVDLSMPVMNGDEFIARARHIYKDNLPPILVCSSSSEMPEIKKVISLGINGYIIKPVDFKSFKAKIQELIPEL